MARKRMAMELISNKRERMVSFEKRKKGLKKAAYQLSTLCGVDIAMIIVCNDESDVWPQNWDTVAKMAKVRNSGLRQCRTYGIHDYLEGKREKVEKEMKKMRESKYTFSETFSRDQLRELSSFLRAKVGAVRETIRSRALAFAPKIEQQQIMACHNNYANLVESRNPYLHTKFIMNPYMPEIIQHDWNLAYYEEQNNIGNQMMMQSNGACASCSQGPGMYNFYGVQDNYAYFSHENCFQNCGMQTEMM